MAIIVHPDLTFQVVAPLDAKIERIEEKIIKRGLWIIKQQRYFEDFLPRTPEREYVSGETHLYLGKRYLLKIKEGYKNSVKLYGGILNVTINKESKTSAKHLLTGWYKEHAEIALFKHYQKNLELFNHYEISTPEMKIQRMKKRWGSYTSSGNIILNPELIKAPVKCIDYVIIHELCHAVEPHHTRSFYQILKGIMPDWKRWKDRLEINSM